MMTKISVELKKDVQITFQAFQKTMSMSLMGTFMTFWEARIDSAGAETHSWNTVFLPQVVLENRPMQVLKCSNDNDNYIV